MTDYREQLEEQNAKLEKLCHDLEVENGGYKNKFIELHRKRKLEVVDFGGGDPKDGFTYKVKSVSYVM